MKPKLSTRLRNVLISTVLLLSMIWGLTTPLQAVRAATLHSTVIITPAAVPTASDNDYTRINDAIKGASDGAIIKLLGTFDWTEANAAASWALGSDGLAATSDDYEILVPGYVNNVTLTADYLGAATIQGPGDLAAANLEGFLVFDATTTEGASQGWTISNLQIQDFDLSIGFFAGNATDYNDTHITNNYIRIAHDLNATVAPVDTLQNIGIHFSFGTNQVISGNQIDIEGDDVSDSGNSNFATEVGMQSNTGVNTTYEGLQITNNIIHVLNAQSADPQKVLGIWENGHAHGSNITVSGNQFINLAAGNNPVTNLQRAFRVTSHSSSTTTVTYADNTVSGANIGFEWLTGANFAGNQPVKLISNTILNGATGVLVQSQGLADMSFNRIVGNTVAGVNNIDGTVVAENNWWGCNAGPGNTGCDATTGTADVDPWMKLNVSAVPSTILASNTSTITADMTYNSDVLAPSGGTLPSMPVTFSATQGTMAPPSGTISAGQANSTFTSTSSSNGTGCATVDNQLVCANITVLVPTSTATETATSTATPTATPTNTTTPTGTLTPTQTSTPTDTLTPTKTFTPSLTPTVTRTATPKGVLTPTATATATATATRTLTRTPTVAPNPNDLIWNQSYSIKYDTWFGVRSSNAFGQGYRKAVSGTFTFASNTPFTQVNWITYRGPDQGKADVFVDGVLKATVNLYHATAQWQYRVSITGLSYKKHTVVIKPLNAKSAASSGKWIAVDGFTLGSGPALRTIYDDQLIYMNNTFGYGSWFGIVSPGGAFSGAYRLSNIAGATASFSFNGTKMTWVTARGPAYGKAQIWIDGVLKQTVDLYRSAQQWQYKVPVFGLASGTHNVVIKVLGTKNPAASNDGVVIDGFEIDTQP